MKRLACLLAMIPGLAWAQQPATLFGTPCPYPPSALHDDIEGDTVVSYRGTKSGEITDVKLVKSSRYYVLDDATLTCVQRWRFDPKQPSSATLIGDHQATIRWTIPFAIPEAPPKPPAGRLVDASHG